MSVSDSVKSLTNGRHTRIVWVQQQEGFDNFDASISDFKIMGFDSEDGLGERCIVENIGAYNSPMITPDGSQIVYTNNDDAMIHIVNWDGSNDRVFAPGFALEVWTDPKDGTVWIYSRTHKYKTWRSKSRPVVKRRLDDPSIEEEVWSKSSISWNWFSVSKDGTHAAISGPWPTCGLIDFKSDSFTQFDSGCWTSIAPDNTYRMWVFDVNHREVKLYDRDGKKLSVIDLHKGDGIKGWEIYHPRWSNDLRFVTVTGPYSLNKDWECTPELRDNHITKGGSNVELYFGKLTPELDAVEEWIQISHNGKADFAGDAWVKPEDN